MSSICTSGSKFPRTTYLEDFKDFTNPANNLALPSVFTMPGSPQCYRENKFPGRLGGGGGIVDALNNLQLTGFTCGRCTLAEDKAAHVPQYTQDPPVQPWRVCDYGRCPPPITPMITSYQSSFKDPRDFDRLLSEFKGCKEIGGDRTVAGSAGKFPPWNNVQYGYKNTMNRYLAHLQHSPINIQGTAYPSHLNIAALGYKWGQDDVHESVNPKLRREVPMQEMANNADRCVNNYYALRECRRGIVDHRLNEPGLRRDRQLQALHEQSPMYKLHTSP